jgi:hypothetical protein
VWRGQRCTPTLENRAANASRSLTRYAGITNATYVGADRREPGGITLEGDWRTERQYIELRRGTDKILLPFTAGQVNLVMQPGSSGRVAVTVLLDGKPVDDGRGADVGADGVAHFDRSGMIRLVARAPRRHQVLTLVTNDPGVRAFLHVRSVAIRPPRRVTGRRRPAPCPKCACEFGLEGR